MLETLAAALPDPVAWAIPAFMILILAEVWWSHRARPASYELKDTAASLMMGAGNLAIGVAYGGLVYTATVWVYERRLFDLPRAWWIFPAVLLAEDVIYYWFHRLSHEHRVWWAAHVNHHSSQHLNLATALRQSWTGNLAFVWVLWLPLAWLGFPPGIIAFQKGISLVYQFWIHTEAIRRLPGGAGVQYAVAPPGAPCDEPPVPGPELCRDPDHLGSPLRDVCGGGGNGALPVRDHGQPGDVQSAAYCLSRVGRDGAGRLAGAGVAGSGAVRVRSTRVESRRVAPHDVRDPPALGLSRDGRAGVLTRTEPSRCGHDSSISWL
jgi:Fatty acid hydroxylase superfamily